FAQSTARLVVIAAAALPGSQLDEAVAGQKPKLAPERHRLLQVGPGLKVMLLVLLFLAAHGCRIMTVG
ncbi:MAG: hypothetical protein J4N75_13300, partial [Chloroflexi bacterium]|nr:hypothetical protein [Chloroflexota bacterium]